MKAGNILAGQSGGPTSVINASLAGIVQTALEKFPESTVYGMRYGIEGFMEENLTTFNDKSKDFIEGLIHTPGSALGSSRYKLQDDDLPRIKELLEKYNIRYYFMTGGNDTMDTINRIEAYCRETGYELTGVGVPKTVDNDLYGTDHTPGFPSAARYIALSVQQGGRLAADMQRVDRYVVFQTVGRDAGWLAAASALAKKHEGDAPHLIIMPERPVKRESYLKKVNEAINRYGWCYTVVGEGAVWDDGTPVSASQTKDNFSNIEFGAMGGSSAALNLHRLINKETGYRGEFQITESLPMCAIDRAVDLDLREAHRCGVEAVSQARDGVSGRMISMERLATDPYAVSYTTVPLKDVAIRAKPMPDEYISADGYYVTNEFLKYCRPLIGELPEYSIL